MIILCTVDITTREVTIPSDQCIASYDHNVDVIRFQVETISGFSLNASSIRIAAQGPNQARHDYAVDPSTVAIEEETGYITFDWPIPAGVTEMPIGTFKYGDTGQLIFAVCAEIISGTTVSKAWHSDDGIITVVAHLEPESGGGEDPSETATNAQKIAQLQTDVAVMGTQVGALANGSPTPVATVAEMTDESAVYLYTGSETGYTAGNWYYYDGTEWTSGGTYGGAATSTTFNQHGVPADDFAVGEALAGKADADDVTALDTRVSDLEEDLDVEIARFDKYDKDGIIELAGYTRGKIKTDGTMGSEVYCVTSNADYVADHPVKITIASGYQIIVSSNNGSGTYTQTSYKKGEWYVYANTPFRITIFTDPISYGQADIDTFASKVTLSANIPYKVDDALHGVDLNHNGLESISGKWGYGTYNSAGTFISYAYYAASIREPIIFDRDAIIHVASGYALYMVLYDSNQTFVTAFAVNTSTCAIPAGQYFAFAVTRSTVDTSEMIDVHEFMLAVSMETVLEDSLHRDLNHSGLYLGWQKGTLNPSGGYASSSIRIVSDFVYAGKGSKIYLNARGYVVAIATYTNDKHYVSVTNYYGYARIIDITDDCYVRILVSKSDVSTISDSEVSTLADAVVIRDAIPFSALSSRLATVENLTENAVVPSYFRAKIDSVINSVEEDIASMGNTGDCFFFLTDVHWNGNAKTSPMLIRALKYNLNVDKIICGGDIISGASKAVSRKEMQEVVASYKNTLPFYCLYGNHDGNYTGTATEADHFTKAEMYAMAQKQTDNLMVYGGLCYFYFDNPATKTRFICLDTGESGAISEAQFTWLSATLESTPANYNIFVFAHILAQATNSWFVGMTFADLTITASMQRVFGVVDDFNTNSDSTKVICIMGGHVHFDCDTTTPNGVPVIFTDADCLSTNTVGGSTKGTMTETCFDVVIANYTTRKIKCVRVGRGSDREFTY